VEGRVPAGGTPTRQLVAAGLVLIVALLLSPVGASAAGSLVSIVDGNGDSKAQVDAGKLRIGDSDGPLTVNGSVLVDGKVRVSNQPADPLSVIDTGGPAIQPLRFQASFSMAENTTGQSTLVYTVPQGRRLVIDTVSFRIQVPSGQYALASVGMTTPEVQVGSASFSIPMQSEGTFNGRITYTGLEDLVILVDPGEKVIAAVGRSGVTGTASALATASGHLVDLP
jgi:hypothetical protein